VTFDAAGVGVLEFPFQINAWSAVDSDDWSVLPLP
jgi:hypothetical protein